MGPSPGCGPTPRPSRTAHLASGSMSTDSGGIRRKTKGTSPSSAGWPGTWNLIPPVRST
ncbi:hypothetical protein ACFFX0_22415 [Citricoccus parietis]|uniref:Uncharacterized protein n=1 Tax=Citricoccus parietis TaxID=592307 RepID=A0ABV5G4E1_9MICC